MKDSSDSKHKELRIELKTDKDWTDYIGTKPSSDYRRIKIEFVK